VAAKIAVSHNDSASEVARGIDAAEVRIRAAVPIARVIYLEPDIFRASDPAPPHAVAPRTSVPASAGQASSPASAGQTNGQAD
jgi:hypothetical protein